MKFSTARLQVSAEIVIDIVKKNVIAIPFDSSLSTVYRRKGSYRFKTAFPEPSRCRKGAYTLKTKHGGRSDFRSVLKSEDLRCK